LQQYEFSEKTLLQCNNENNTVFYVGCAYNIFKDTNDYLFKRCSDVKNFLHRELCCAARGLTSARLDRVLEFCSQQEIDFNKRNEDGKRPVDIAIKNYAFVAQEGTYNSDYFINKEKIMHAFMRRTERIEDVELSELLQSNGLVD